MLSPAALSGLPIADFLCCAPLVVAWVELVGFTWLMRFTLKGPASCCEGLGEAILCYFWLGWCILWNKVMG